MNLILRWVLSALALMAAPYLIVGVYVRSFWTALLVSVFIAVLYMIVRPILVLLTLPITVFTMGLFLLVINALLIYFAGSVLKGFEVAGFWPALWLGLYLWVVSLLINTLLAPRRA